MTRALLSFRLLLIAFPCGLLAAGCAWLWRRDRPGQGLWRHAGLLGLATFGGAARVLTVELDRVAEHFATGIVHCEFSAVLGVETQRRVLARGHERVCNVDRVIWTDVDAA